MKVNLPTKVRFGIYVLTGLGDIVVAYLVATGFLGANETAAWVSLSAFVKGLAALNTPVQEV